MDGKWGIGVGGRLKKRLQRRRLVWGENSDGMALDKLLTFSFCLSVRTFPGLNSGDPDTLPLSTWKHLDIPYHLPTKTWVNMKKKVSNM